MRKSAQITGVVILILLILVSAVWYAAMNTDRRGILTVSFLNVGEGDAIFIEAPSGRQVLIDGGPDASVVRALAAVMPWYDRSIDVVIPTHPDSDHIMGLIDVIDNYQVGLVVDSSVQGTTATWDTLNKTIASHHIRTITAQRGQIIDLGDGAYLQVLSPDRAVPHVDTNVGCVVTRIVYGKTSFMLPCDAPQSVENYLVKLGGKELESTVLKAGHHGSKTSSSPLFVGFVSPQYVVYSRGCDNKFGFPSPETVDLFKHFGISTLDTCVLGTITFTSNGQTVTSN